MNIKSEKLFQLLSKIIFGLYICLLVWVVVFKCNLINSVTQTYEYFKSFTLAERFNFYLVPFKDYFEGPFLIQIRTIIEDDILNLLLFVPFGMYLTLFIKKGSLYKVIILTFVLSLFFESFQLFSLIGSFATKDLITNVLGSLLGYLICKLVYKEKNGTLKLMILNILSIIVICIVLPIVVYSIYNTIKNINIYFEIIFRI